jgi:cytochrome c oxidase cbb3-type subunit III
MRTKVTAVCLSLLSAAVVLAQQRGAPAVPAGQRAAPTNFPAQQRPVADAALLARGKTLYEIHCRSCHGADLRGGELGGPNLLRSAVALNDQAGELIYPVIRDGRKTPGMSAMPPISISEDDAKTVAEYIHSILATTQRQGGPPPAPRPVLNVLVGEAAAGKSYFEAKCASCHSVTGDLRNIGEKFPDPVQLQNSWLAGNAGGGGRGSNTNRVTVTVTPASGAKIEGGLGRIDDFIVVVNLEDGSSVSFRRQGDIPKVEVHDPRDAHRNLLPQYRDKDIHDVTAYLVTLK